MTDVEKQQLQTNYEEKTRGKQNKINSEGQLYSLSRMINVFFKEKNMEVRVGVGERIRSKD